MTQWSFVRIGASRKCDGCGTRFVIDRAHVARLSRTQAGGKNLLDSAVASEIPPRVDEQGNVVGLSGLTEMMQREPRPAAEGSGVHEPPPAAVRRSSVQAVRTQQRRQDVRWLYILLGIMVALMILLGLSIWFATNLGSAGSPRFAEPTDAAPPIVSPPPQE